MDVTGGGEESESVSLKRRILLKIVHGMTYGTAGAPKTAAAIAVTKEIGEIHSDKVSEWQFLLAKNN